MPAKNTPAIDPAALAAALAALGVDIPAPAKQATPAKQTPAKRRNGKPASPRVARERKPASAPAKRTPAKRTSAKRVCNITAGEAWEALGADPEFKPGNLDKPASGPMLWNLNSRGLLADLLA